MKHSTITLFGFLLLSFIAAAQDFEVPANIPATKDEFIKSETDFIAAAKWLESIPVGTWAWDDKRSKMKIWILTWIGASQNSYLNLSWDATKLYDENTQLLTVFMAGYIRYRLENNYSTDQLKASTAGVKSSINCYKLGGDVKKNKKLTAAINADKEGKLEDWVREAMKDM